MPYLIDTDIIIYSLKGHALVHENLLRNENIPKHISIITYGELLYGAKKSKNVGKNAATVYRIKELFPTIPVDLAIIETFSDLKAILSGQGDAIDDLDLLIGATALAYNYTLVTNNTKHFNRIEGLRIENWSI